LVIFVWLEEGAYCQSIEYPDAKKRKKYSPILKENLGVVMGSCSAFYFQRRGNGLSGIQAPWMAHYSLPMTSEECREEVRRELEGRQPKFKAERISQLEGQLRETLIRAKLCRYAVIFGAV
jgi:hypothetical protein